MSSICCICLVNVADCRKLNESDDKGNSWLKKLQIIVPELGQVSSKFVDDSLMICECCVNQIEEINKFKHHLLELIAKHKLRIHKDQGYLHEFQSDGDLNDSIEHQTTIPSNSFQDDNEQTFINTFNNNGSPEEQNLRSLLTEQESYSEITIEKTELSKNNKNPLERGIKEDSFVCSSCHEFQTSKKNLKQHLKSCTKLLDNRKEIQTTKYSCEMCDLRFDYIRDIRAHCRIVHCMDEKTVKPYICDICSCRFTSLSNYSQHQKYHDGTRNYICPLCGKTFITKSDLIVHEHIHRNHRNYKCPICEKAFNTNKNLRTHNLVVHTDRSLWKYKCSICEKKFPLKGNFDQHMKRHSGDKQYTCHVCEKCFISGTELKRHVSLHTNIRAFACEYCRQEYKTVRTLNIHLKRAHSVGDAKLPLREKKYVCHICPSQFYDKQKLTRHLYGHSGMKPFSCLSCDKKFSDKSYLSHHLRISHNIIENTVN